MKTHETVLVTGNDIFHFEILNLMFLKIVIGLVIEIQALSKMKLSKVWFKIVLILEFPAITLRKLK